MPRDISTTLARTIIPLCVAAFGALHALAIAIYLLPPSPLKTTYGGRIVSYVNSLFRQNWHLFSPNPGTSYNRLQVRCKQTPESWGPWFDPAGKIQSEHYASRVTGKGKLLYVYRRIGDAVWTDLTSRMRECRVGNNDNLKNTVTPTDECSSTKSVISWLETKPSIQRATHLAQRACDIEPGSNTQVAPQIRLVRVLPIPYSKRLQENLQREAVIFPITLESDNREETSHAAL